MIDGESVGQDEEEVRSAVASSIGEDPGDGLRNVDIIRQFLDSSHCSVDLPDRAHLDSQHALPDPLQFLRQELIVIEVQRDAWRFLVEDVAVQAVFKDEDLDGRGLRGIHLLLCLSLQHPIPRNSGWNGLVLCKFLQADVDQQIGGFLLHKHMVHKALKLLAPLDRLPHSALEAQRRLLRGREDDAVVELDPIGLIGILGSIDDGIVVAAVVGLSSVHCHAEQNVFLLEARGCLLQEAEVDLVRVFELSQDLCGALQHPPVFVSFEVEEDDVGKRPELPHLAHVYLAVLVSVDLVVHYLLFQQLPQRLMQLP